MPEPLWHPERALLADGLEALMGPVNAGVLRREGKLLLVNSLPPRVLEQAGLSPAGVETILLTHAYQTACEGAAALAALGAGIRVPAGERWLFETPERFWADDAHRIRTYERFHPSHLSPQVALPVAAGIEDGEVFAWRGVPVRAIGAVGPTDAGLSYLVEVDGRRIAFVGDLMWGHGRIHDLHSLQGKRDFAQGGGIGEYHGYCERASQVLSSLERVLEFAPHVMVPSRGEVVRDPASAVAALRGRLEAFLDEYHATTSLRWYFPGGHPKWPADRSRFERRLRPLPAWVREIGGTSRAVVAPTGEALMIDCDGDVPERIDGMRGRAELGPIEALWVTHFHFDHTGRVNDLRARQGCAVLVHETMADILARPDAWLLPCLHPEPIPADRVTRDGESWEWRDFHLTAVSFPGQTLYDGALLVERGGESVLFVGDSLTPGGLDDYCAQNRNLLGSGLGLARCLEILDTMPAGCVLVNQHVDGAFVLDADDRAELLASLARRFEAARQLLPGAAPNDGLDPYWVSADPYFQRVDPGQHVRWTVRIRNHGDAPAEVTAWLREPRGWLVEVGEGSATAAPGEDALVRLSGQVPRGYRPGRTAVGVTLRRDEQLLPAAAVALVEVSG
jgi:glyoxylase-like metal-dependent hydrolase (beta-lactamase superfamily II)